MGLTWAPGCGRRPTTGDVVPSRTGRAAVVLSGRDGGKALRCTGRLSASEARALARQAAQGTAVGAAVVRERAGHPAGRVIPHRAPERYRAVLRWTLRAIGRPAGLRACLAGLRAIGWCKPVGKGA